MTKPLLCLLHAFPLFGDLFAAQREALADVADVFTPDLPANPSVEGMALAVNHAIAKRDTGAPIIVGGVSMGGNVAMAFARLLPARIAGIVLVDTSSKPDDDAGRALRDQNIAIVREQGVAVLVEAMLPRLLGKTTLASRPDVVDAVRKMGLARSPEWVVAALEALRDRPDARPGLGRLGVPNLCIYGGEDVITPATIGEEIIEITGGDLVVIPDSGHLPAIETPDAFNAALRTFLVQFMETAS